MKISLNWIKEFVDIPTKYSAKQLAELLTLRTCEVEGYEDQGRGLEGVVVGEMLEISKHPNADKLNIAKVDIGRRNPLNLIFGQMVTIHVGDRIPVAIAPTVLPTGIKIEAKDLRGVRSEGMLCLEQELSMKETGVSILYFPKTKPGTPLAKALGLNDVIFDIDNKSLTHRPDLWGHYGMAREFAAFLGKRLKPWMTHVPVPKSGSRVKIDITKKEIAARFLSVIITGIRVEESPPWIRQKLTAIGMRPVNNIVDITNYVMHELGHPLHAFDRRVVKNDHFVIRFAKDGEIIETLDHKKRALHAEDALVTNGEKALGIAGVMGGKNSEIRNDTTEILLEAAAWNPVMIRKTATRHGLRSDAAQRFEKSLDPEITGFAFHRACELILKICPEAKLAGLPADVYPAKQKIRKLGTVTLDLNRVNRKIGVEISEKEAISHLKALEFGVMKGEKRTLMVQIPTFRATKDINIEDDLVEEIARMYGYEKITSVLPSLPIKLPSENKERILKHQARNILSLGLGFSETSHYSFYGSPEIRQCLLPETAHVLIDNPLSNDQTHLRVSLLPHLLKSVALNLYHRESFRFYEIGRTYIKTQEYFPREEKFICCVMVNTASKREIFYDTLGVLQTFLERFGTKARIDVSENPPPYAHPLKYAVVKSGNSEVAIVYEIHPQVLKNFGVDAACAAFEINFTKLVAAGQTARVYRPLPRFPGIEIDISVLVKKQTPVREVLELIRHTDQKLIAGTRLIDIFEDKSLGPDKKSFTFRVLLQSPDRTLTDEEMKQVREGIFKTLRDSGFSIR